MQLHLPGAADHLLFLDGLHGVRVLLRGHPQAGEGGGGVVAFDGAGRIMGGPEAAAKGFHYIWGSLSGIYKELGANCKDCIGCGNCESHCPQKIKIIDLLKQIDDKYTELEKTGE